MKRIYVVRHGQTGHNEAGLVQDHLSELSDMGKEQARLLGERLESINYQHLVISDYVRTKQTAEYLRLPESVEMKYSHLVREQRRPSEFFNQPNSTPEFWQFLEQEELNLSDPNWHWSDEENFYDVVSRVEKTYQLANECSGDVLIVTHGRFIVYFTVYMLFSQHLSPNIWKLCKYNFGTSNTGLTVFEWNDRFENWRLKTYNDIAHFAE